MKTLILTRHAKSDWADPTQDDHDRPLNKRGRKAAPRVGQWIADRAMPAEALVSTAARAQETWAAMVPAFTPRPRLHSLRQLYLASPQTLLKCLHQAKADTVLMIAHNPGIAEFARAILALPPEDDSFARYPTAATLIASFKIASWPDAAFGTATADAFTTPRALAD